MPIAIDQRESRWTKRDLRDARRQNARDTGVRGDRPGAREESRGARDARHRHQAHAEPLPHVDKVYSPEETYEVLGQSDFVLLLLPVTPATENFINTNRLSADEADRVAAQLRTRRADRRRRPHRRGEVEDDRGRRPRRVPPRAPADSHPFWKTEGILVLPHLGGGGPSVRRGRGDLRRITRDGFSRANRSTPRWTGCEATRDAKCPRSRRGRSPRRLPCPGPRRPSDLPTAIHPAPLTIIVPFAAGAVTDIETRLYAQKLTESTGRTFVVDYKLGAGSMIGSAYVAKAPADGYTLLATTQALSIAPLSTRTSASIRSRISSSFRW